MLNVKETVLRQTLAERSPVSNDIYIYNSDFSSSDFETADWKKVEIIVTKLKLIIASFKNFVTTPTTYIFHKLNTVFWLWN